MAASKAAYFLQADKHESRLPTDAEWQHLGKATFKFIKHFKDSAERQMEVNLSTESSDSSGSMPGLMMSSSDEEDDADDKSDTNMVHA